MLKQRRAQMIRYIEEQEHANVEELAELLCVSAMTVRRDLKYLEENKYITRTYGGAVMNPVLREEVPYKEKQSAFHAEKVRIAKKAATLVEENQTLILDAGTTTFELAKCIKDKKNLTVVTTDLLIALYLSKYENIEVYHTGGYINGSIGASVGTTAINFLDGICADIAFIGTNAFSLEKGVTTNAKEKAMIKKKMMAVAHRAVLITDHSKYNKVSFAKIDGLDAFSQVIIDKGLEKKEGEKIIKAGIQLNLV